MKKIFNLIISYSLAFIAFFSFTTSNVVTAQAAEKPHIAERLTFTDGVHQLDADPVEGEDYIVKDGDFKYTIVMSANQAKKDGDALAEFKILLKRAIGNVPVSVIFDNEFTSFNPEQQYISIGYTKLLEFANADTENPHVDSLDKLDKNGLRIKTVGKTIFLVGGIDNGILNAVYTFFRLAFNYEQFTKNCLVIDTNVKNLKLLDFDVLDLPDIEYCSGTYGPNVSFKTPKESDYKALLQGDVTRDDIATEIRLASERLKFYTNANNNLVNLVTGEYRGVSKTSSNHSSMLVMSVSHQNVPGNENINYNPSLWHSDSGQQVCYTAHGKAAALQDMKQYAANYFINKMKINDTNKYPGADFYPFANMDGKLYCDCKACLDSITKYNGAYAGANIEFINDVCDIIVAEQKKSLEDGNPDNDAWVRENFKFLVFAYQNTKEAPAEYDYDLKKYVALNGLELSEHICIMFTDYPEARYSLYDERHTDRVASVQAWGDIAHHLYAWNYGENYQSKGVFLDTLNGFSTERAQHMASMGVTWNFTEIQSSNEVVSTWHNLQYYMIGQMSWDSTYNAEELIDKFFNAYYGYAADTMKALYYNQRLHSAHMTEQYYKENKKILPVGHNNWTTTDYPYELIKGWINRTEFALTQIEQYKNIDMDLYDTYKDRINVESMQYFWIIYQYHSGVPPYTLDEKQRYIERALDIATRYKNAYFKEGVLREWAKE